MAGRVLGLRARGDPVGTAPVTPEIARRAGRVLATPSMRRGSSETPDLGRSLVAGLDWIAFNVERAIGVRPASAAESKLAGKIVPEMLADLPD